MPMKFESVEARRAFYRDLMRQRRAAEKAGGKPSGDRRCAFCRKPQAQLWGTHTLICDRCAADAVKAMLGIVIAADKVTTMADHWRKEDERRARAREKAAAKRKAKG
jgi:hypothetical protein